MDIDKQIETLIKEAPSDGITGQAVQAVAPALKAIALQLKHSQYYILQTLDQGWVMTTLSHQSQPNVQKNVVHAFPTLQDAAAGPYSVKDPQVMALPMPVTHILFQMLALKSIHSVIFFDQPGDLKKGVEVRREDFQTLLQTQLKQAQGMVQAPSDIA